MDIQCRIVDGVVILDLLGKIRIGGETEAIRTQVNALSNSGVKYILLNLDGIIDIDSSGLGELVSAFTTARRRGTKVKLLHLTGRVRQLMVLTKLLTVFDDFDDEQAAVASFYDES